MSITRKYGSLLTVNKALQIDLYQLNGVDLESNAVFATGDVKISKNGDSMNNLPWRNGRVNLILETQVDDVKRDTWFDNITVYRGTIL